MYYIDGAGGIGAVWAVIKQILRLLISFVILTIAITGLVYANNKRKLYKKKCD